MGCQSVSTNRSIGIFALFFGFAGTVLMAEEKPEGTFKIESA